MKNIINYFYNLMPENINKQKNFFYFWFNGNKFYFVPCINDEKKIIKIYDKFLSEKRKINKIIMNKDGNLITLYKNEKYVLLMVDCIENEIVEPENFFNIKMDDKIVSWSSIWEQKIDYFEYQINQRGLGKDNILNSFSYYAGLAENAVEYYNLIDKKEVSVGVQHKRLSDQNYEINYYNPLNLIIDYNVRDVAEYIKFLFFFGNFNEDKIIRYLDKLNLNNTMFNLLYARLLFPTCYFDYYEKFINEEDDEKKLLDVISKASNYENFLKKLYYYFSKKYKLIRIEWILSQ